ncbi:hypothetical protein BRARA_A02346 [Brassica rapa]|uniref:Uncharacterized protein n=1 Tax=Brassica campestris TaxID=3711 RepID=A0A398APN4_BRACM|nr:hypothetical protein BRARA_A02346 [Brassica rapa]
MTVPKRYVLRLFMSIKYITANVVDKNNGRVVTTASTVEHAVKNSLECGRTCSAKAAAILEEVLAMRLKVEGHQDGQGRGIHVDVKKEIEKKGNNGVTLILDDFNVDEDKYYRYCSDEGHQ